MNVITINIGSTLGQHWVNIWKKSIIHSFIHSINQSFNQLINQSIIRIIIHTLNKKSTSMAIFQHWWRFPMSTQCRLALSIADVDFRRWIIDVEKSPSMSILISLSIANDDFEKSPPMLKNQHRCRLTSGDVTSMSTNRYREQILRYCLF